MIHVCLLMLLNLSNEPFMAFESEVPLSVANVLMLESGEVFILDRGQGIIRRFNREGHVLAEMGGKGKGPGEFLMASRMFFHRETLYVLDLMAASVNLFEPKGAFIERVRLPARSLDVVKVTNGWVYGDWNQFAYDPDGKAHVWWAGPGFDGAVRLFQVLGRGAKGTFVNDGTTSIYSPVSATPHLTVNRAGTRVFVAHGTGFRIEVVDPVAKKVVHVIERREKVFAFNADWADVRLNEVKAMMPDIVFKTNYPETFPVIRAMFWHPAGWLVVDRWTADPGQSHAPLMLDERGREIEPQLDWDDLARWVGSHGDLAYVAVYDSDRETFGLARCPKSDVAGFVARHPLNDGEL